MFKGIFWLIFVVLSPIAAILCFIGINIPLILFDCLLKLINLVSGASLFNQLISGVYQFNPNDPVFIIYMIVIGLSLFLIIFAIIKVGSKSALNPNFETKTNTKNLFSKKAKWIVLWVFGIFIIPIIFSISTVLMSLISSVFAINSYTYNPYNVETINAVINGYKNTINNLIIDNQKLLDFVNTHKDKFSSDVDVNLLIRELIEQKNYLNNFLSNLNSLKLNDNFLTENSANLLNQLINDINKFSQVNTSDLNYWLINFAIDPEKSQGIQLINNFTNSQNNFIKTIANGINVNGSFLKLDTIYYHNAGKYYDGWRAEQLTLDLASSIYGWKVTNLFYIPFAEITSSSTEESFNSTILFRIVFGCIASIGIFFVMINILIKLAKRTFELLYLLMISPLAIAQGISDNGEKYDLWLKTTTGKMIIVFFASLVFQLLQILSTPLFDWTNSLNFDNNIFINDILRMVLVVVIFFASLIAAREIIEAIASTLGDSSKLNNAGLSARKNAFKFLSKTPSSPTKLGVSAIKSVLK